MKWYLRACPVCGGDLHEDIEDRGWVTCFLCARSFPVAQVQSMAEGRGVGRGAIPQRMELPKAA